MRFEACLAQRARDGQPSDSLCQSGPAVRHGRILLTANLFQAAAGPSLQTDMLVAALHSRVAIEADVEAWRDPDRSETVRIAVDVCRRTGVRAEQRSQHVGSGNRFRSIGPQRIGNDQGNVGVAPPADASKRDRA